MVCWDSTLFYKFSDAELLTMIDFFAYHKYELPQKIQKVSNVDNWKYIMSELMKEIGQREALIK